MRNIQVVKNSFNEPSFRVIVNDDKQGNESIEVVSFTEIMIFILKHKEKQQDK